MTLKGSYNRGGKKEQGANSEKKGHAEESLPPWTNGKLHRRSNI
jgi:hypothetical protein